MGDSFQQADVTVDSGVDFDGDGKTDKLRVQASAKVIGLESVSTDAGGFPQAAHVVQTIIETVTPSSGAAAVSINIQADDWYVDGIGSVQSTQRITGPGTDETMRSGLSTYRVGSLKSDMVAPTVTSTTPAAGPLKGSAAMVTATFSEPIDPASVQAGTLTVTDGSNTAVPGGVQLSANVLSFTPAQPWVSGSYTVQLTTDVQDLFGNPLASARSWHFTIDATAPVALSVSPASGATLVDLATPIVLTFSEPPASESVTSYSVQLMIGSTPVASTIAVAGNTVTLTPTQPLSRGSTYTVSVSGVTDQVGNPMGQNFSSHFQTLQGMFAASATLFSLPPSTGIQGLAVGDINGDGLKDFVYGVIGNLVRSNDGLLMRAGRPDGTLGDAVRIDTGSSLTCQISSVAMADVNGDGRPDLVVGGGPFCGAQVLHQATDGSLTLGEYLGTSQTQLTVVVDLDRNGRNVLVTAGGNNAVVTIWRPDGNGVLQSSQTLDGGVGYVRDIAMGDVNGDGLPDLVVALGDGQGQDIALFIRNADGSFAAPRFLSTGSPWGASSIAVGDVNGDLRADVVATTGGNTPTYFAVFYQASDGSIGPAMHISTFDSPAHVSLGDLNVDGLLDIVITHDAYYTASVYVQRSDGMLAAEQRFGSFNGSPLLSDLNGDGRPDIVVGNAVLLQLPPLAASASIRAQRMPAVAVVKRALAAKGSLK